MTVFAFAPLSRTLPYWPTELFGEPGGLLDEIGITDFEVVADDTQLKFTGTVAWLREIEFKLPALDAVSIAFLSTNDFTQIPFEVQVSPEFELRLTQLNASVRLRTDFLRPVKQEGGKWVPLLDAQGEPLPVEITLGGVDAIVSADGDVSLDWGPAGAPTLALTPIDIGGTGIVLEMNDVALYLSEQQQPPPGGQQGFKGVAINDAKLHLSGGIDGIGAPNTVLFKDLLISNSGFSGSIDAQWTNGTGQLFGMPFTLKSLSLTFQQNVPTGSSLKGTVDLPFFDHPVNVELGFGPDGGLTVGIDSTAGDGLAHLTIPNALDLELDSLKFQIDAGVMKVIVSGKLTPLAGGINWPSFDVRELAIDNKGRIYLKGGWFALPKAYSINFHGAKLEITKFGIGKTDDGGRYIGVSGGIELGKGLAGASVEGLKISWHPHQPGVNVTLNGIGIKFKTPAVSFDGHVSYTRVGSDNQFKGELTLLIPAANNLKLVGKAVFGTSKGTKYFAIYLEGVFGTGLPLGSTGVALFGIAGLLAVNYAPDKPGTMLWYSVDHGNSFFHKPQTGVTDIIRKWKPEAGTFAIGAGAQIGTQSDRGYTFNGKFLLLLLLPGPMVMLDGSVAVLRKLSDPTEPPFHGLIVLDNRAGYFLVGLDVRWKKDAEQGDIADISGSMEVFFSYRDPRLCHFWLGKKEMAQRIRASFAKAFTANAYFMLDARQLAVGVWIGSSKHYKWGPVGADMDAWMAADALVNFKPAHVYAHIEFYGYFAIKVFKFRLAIGMDAYLAADVAKPFHIKGALDINIETRIKKFHIHMGLEWGPRIVPPELNVPITVPRDELALVQSWGIVHSKSANDWPLQLPGAAKPEVPVDSRPYFTFAFPMLDLHGVGVNAAVPVPEWSVIGDPGSGQGSAKAKFSLTGITLYRVAGNTETPIAAHPKPANAPAGFGDIYGTWAPTVPGTSGGQNRLMLWSANPLDFADENGSWNPWLSSNLPGYPCPPDTTPEIICMDFETFAVGQQLEGSSWHPQDLDFQIAWPEAGPHPVVTAPSSGTDAVHGLSFPAAMPRHHYRTYVSNFDDNTVSLVDVLTRKVIKTIRAGAHPRQVALSPDGKRAYVCNQGDNTVIVIDTAANLRVGAPVAVVKSPASIAVSRDGKRAFVRSDTVANMSVIDLQSLRATPVQLRAVADQVVVSPDGKKLYVTHGPMGAISVLDAASLKLVKTVAAVGGPAAMVIHPSAPRAWVSFPSRGTVRLLDTGADELTALETPTGKFVRDLALSPDGGRLYAGNLQDNSVSVLDTVSLDVIATIPTPGPAGLQMTPDGAALLVANSFTNTIAIVDPLQNQVVAQGIAAGLASNSFAVLPAPPPMLWRALVANQGGNVVSVIDLQTGKRVSSIAVGRAPLGIAVTPDGKRAYVSNQDDNTVTVIDIATGKTVGAAIAVARRPESISIASDGKTAFVISGAEQKISVIDLAVSRICATIALPGGGDSVTLSADGKKGYAMCGPANAIAVFAPGSFTVTRIVATPSAAQFMALHPSQPRAFVSFPNEAVVREFDTGTERFTGKVIKTGAWPQNLCFSPDGTQLYVCNFRGNTISVIDSATLQVTATIANVPGPKAPAFTSDGSMLVVASYTGSTISMIDPVTNKVLGNPVPCPPFPYALVLQGAAGQEQPLPPLPVDVTIDVPAGSSSIEVTWAGGRLLRATVSVPSGQTREIAAAAGSTLKLDVAALDPAGTTLARSGIDQIRLRCDSAWTLLRVCVTRLPFAGGLASQQVLNSAFHQQVEVLKKPSFLLDPGQEYRIRLDWSASVEGMNELKNWSESFANFTELTFTTALPPSLGTVSDPNVPPRIPSTVKGLDDLSLYVRRTIPVTQPADDRLPVLTKPVFRGYDVTVEFNENYVDQLYLMAGRDLDLILFDRNNEAVRDAPGQLIIVEDAWGNSPTLTLTNTQALWIEMFNANTCELTPIDPLLIPTSKILRADEAHVLAADSVYEARLVPQLVHQARIVAATWTAAPFAADAVIYNPGTPPAWTDYRISVLVTLATSDPVGILFGCTGNDYYEFIIDPGSRRRRLTQVSGGASTTLREDYYVYHPGQDDPYRVRIEAVGSQILISQNGAVVFTVVNAASLAGTAGLRQPIAVFTDFGVSDLSAGAPVAYRFHFTTSKFTNFYHQIHSFQDRIWTADRAAPLDLSAAVSSSPTGELPALSVTDMEARAYDDLAFLALGSASAQDPPQLDVTRLEHANAVLGWLVRSPEPIDHTRAQITLSALPRILARGKAPGAVKIAEAEFGDTESVTLLAREAIDLTGYRVEQRQMPSALADESGGRILWQGDGSDIAGDQTWTDYRTSVVCRSQAAGGIGIRFRYVDDQNFYAFTYDFVSGLQRIVRTESGVSTELGSVLGDPAPGIPDAPAVALAVSVLGSQIACYRGGKNVLQVSDSTFPTGGAGTLSAGNADAQFDGFEVHRLPNESYALLRGQFSTTAMTGWLAAADGSGLQLNVIDATVWSNAVLRVRMQQDASGAVGLLLRYQDAGNHYRLLFTDTERRFERVAGGVVTALWSSPLTTAMNRSNEITVSLLDTLLCVFQNAIAACEIADASFATGTIGLCKAPGADFTVSQLVLYPPGFAFSTWTVRDEFQQLGSDSWTLLDDGDQGGPSNWQAVNGRLTQTSAISDSGHDPVRQRGTLALYKDANPAESRLVTRLLTAQTGAIGVVFGYQDANNFCRLSMNATADPTAQYRRLVSCVNGSTTVLWADTASFDHGRDYVLTLDLIDDCATAWLDGEQIFRCKLPGSVVGSFGLYCCDNTGASFGNFRVGAAAWIPYYRFGHELPLAAGNRVKIGPAITAAPNRRTSMRLATELDDIAVCRLAPAGANLRVVAPDRTVQHSREFVPAEEFAQVPFQALREADGTGIFLTPTPAMTPDQTPRLSFRYRRDNDIIAFTEIGESGDELVSIDLPTA